MVGIIYKWTLNYDFDITINDIKIVSTHKLLRDLYACDYLDDENLEIFHDISNCIESHRKFAGDMPNSYLDAINKKIDTLDEQIQSLQEQKESLENQKDAIINIEPSSD